MRVRGAQLLQVRVLDDVLVPDVIGKPAAIVPSSLKHRFGG